MRMEAVYGSAWSSRLASDEAYAIAVDEWGRQLAYLTESKLRVGLDKLSGKFPPTPMDFHNSCLDRFAGYR